METKTPTAGEPFAGVYANETTSKDSKFINNSLISRRLNGISRKNNQSQTPAPGKEHSTVSAPAPGNEVKAIPGGIDWNLFDFAGFSAADEYNFRGDALELLMSHGWKSKGEQGEKVHLVNKDDSATFHSDKTFFVDKSTNQFEAGKGYKPFHVFAILETSGDFKEAEIRLKADGYGLKENERKRKAIYPDYLDNHGKPDAYMLHKFLMERGLIRISTPGDDRQNVYRIDNKILRQFNSKTDTISFLASTLSKQQEREVSNLLFKHRNSISDVFKLMPGEVYNLQRDTKETVYLPFSNGVAKITAGGAELIGYGSDELKYFIETESQKHDFSIVDFSNRTPGNFEKFILYAITGREATYKELTEADRRDVWAFHSMIGYLISNYKNAAITPAVILSDEGADDEARKGRRGKTILTKAIQVIRRAEFRGGNEFDPTYRHRYAGLDERTNLFVLDDVPAGFDYNSLYTQIAGDITAERKGSAAVEIPFHKAPKFVITTNWAVRYDQQADSTNDRFREYKFSNFWNGNNKPDTYFGELFFQDWDSDQWQRFFEFIVSCVMIYLKKGLQEIRYSKADDNFRAYFANDVLLQEFERVWKEMQYKLDTEKRFLTQEFLEVHRMKFSYNQLFNHINVKKYILAYSEKHGEGILQNSRREWVRSFAETNPKNDVESQYPF